MTNMYGSACYRCGMFVMPYGTHVCSVPNGTTRVAVQPSVPSAQPATRVPVSIVGADGLPLSTPEIVVILAKAVGALEARVAALEAKGESRP